MSHNSERLLKRSTSRAKSDVANKLVSMLLHELSKKACQRIGLSVNSSEYGKLFSEFFGQLCPYCQRDLDTRKPVVEHLDGMNRFRAGLHTPGNVVVSCSECNSEKRRDDQVIMLSLANSGWESFLSHDSLKCPSECKTCAYWFKLFPDNVARSEHLQQAVNRIRQFRNIPAIEDSIKISTAIQSVARHELEDLYRAGQGFAKSEIHLKLGVIEAVINETK